MRENDHRYTNPSWSIQELKEKKHLIQFLTIFLLVLPLNLYLIYFIKNTLSKLAPFFMPISIVLSFLISIAILYSFYLLIVKNRDFILYDIFYTQALKIKILTITDDLSPFTPITQELEKIIIGRNRNQEKSTQENRLLKDKILFFWIRKNIDKSLNNEERKKIFRPFLSLIIILYALKEKRFKLIGVIGIYFTIIGFFFTSYSLIFLESIANLYELSDTWVAIILISFLLYWYIWTIYSSVKLVSIDTYLDNINQEIRRPYLRKKIQLGDSYHSNSNYTPKTPPI